eukprot:CAMPEP_0174868194 /NCGR_PEP_ID=MMETSP1114-20130205/65496_1 /TAXON_ID=312471 /ORGANISM="Neobodo designis, Strain CCAP 1951/1" /LENGTH=49 /DNA_ID= /DNA_START= /DNA_END= /DNA_ORIENTATION=
MTLLFGMVRQCAHHVRDRMSHLHRAVLDGLGASPNRESLTQACPSGTSV